MQILDRPIDLPIAQESRCPCSDPNARHRVAFRHAILRAQAHMEKLIAEGLMIDCKDQSVLKHYYTPIDKEFGCAEWGRVCWLPAHTHTIGKIHRQHHLNYILSGSVRVWTEYGQDSFKAPMVFVSQPYTKRAVYAESGTLWSTVHLTKYPGEENIEQAEEEIFAKSYEELGLCAQPPSEDFPVIEWLKQFRGTRGDGMIRIQTPRHPSLVPRPPEVRS